MKVTFYRYIVRLGCTLIELGSMAHEQMQARKNHLSHVDEHGIKTNEKHVICVICAQGLQSSNKHINAALKPKPKNSLLNYVYIRILLQSSLKQSDPRLL